MASPAPGAEEAPAPAAEGEQPPARGASGRYRRTSEQDLDVPFMSTNKAPSCVQLGCTHTGAEGALVHCPSCPQGLLERGATWTWREVKAQMELPRPPSTCLPVEDSQLHMRLFTIPPPFNRLHYLEECDNRDMARCAQLLRLVQLGKHYLNGIFVPGGSSGHDRAGPRSIRFCANFDHLGHGNAATNFPDPGEDALGDDYSVYPDSWIKGNVIVDYSEFAHELEDGSALALVTIASTPGKINDLELATMGGKDVVYMVSALRFHYQPPPPRAQAVGWFYSTGRRYNNHFMDPVFDDILYYMRGNHDDEYNDSLRESWRETLWWRVLTRCNTLCSY